MKRLNNDFEIDEMLGELRQSRLRAEEEEELYCPLEIARWVAQLKLLTGIPLSCLAGDEKQLPSESIRFFYIDDNWTDQLVNGALSIGADDTKAQAINTFFTSDIYINGIKNLHIPREKRIHETQKRFYTRGAVNSENKKLTGFLLRSRLVRLWKGLESAAWDKTGESIPIRRMEQLSEEIMICVYQGEIARLRIKEPKEGLRFGTHENDRTINIRDIKQGNEGRPIPNKKAVIHTNAYGRADILTLANDLKKTLNTEHFTSAEMAMELITAPGLAEFYRGEEGEQIWPCNR